MKIEILLFLFITIVFTFFYVRKMNSKGCISFAYIGLLILSINAFTIFSWIFLCNSLNDIYTVSMSESKYYAKVVSTTSEEHYDDESGEYYTMYTPTVKFTTNRGTIIRKKLNFSTSNERIGKTYKVHYDETTDTIITLGFIMIIKTVGAFIFCLIFSFLFIGLLLFILNCSMDNYKYVALLVGIYFFIPFLMIGFNLLLIYSLFYGNTVPFFVTLLLLFFITILSLAIVGYIKMLISEDIPKINRVGYRKKRSQ